jgi:hypothetical protein
MKILFSNVFAVSFFQNAVTDQHESSCSFNEQHFCLAAELQDTAAGAAACFR